MKKIHYPILCLFVLCTLLSGCFHEYPEDGEAINPTQVKVEVEVSLDFTVNPLVWQTRADAAAFRRRFIVDVYRDDNPTAPAERKVLIFDDIKTEGESFRLPVTLALQPLDYILVVWTDHIAAGTDEDYFYNTATLSDVHCLSPYRGNSIYRDALYGATELDLSEYRGKWGETLRIPLQMERAASPVRWVATDYDLFVEKHGKKVAEGAKVVVNYGFYLPQGFNALTGLPQRSELSTSFTAPLADAEVLEEGLQIASDYIFAGDEETFAVVNLDVTDAEGKLLNRVENLKVKYKKGYLTTLKSNFLTSEESSNIHIDVEFDEDILIDLDKQ
ncbi:DUF6562 domain-containing protein [Bacteroides uniformis]|nr:DUF6562 domain-containing protein [Bacteroides uniformis]